MTRSFCAAVFALTAVLASGLSSCAPRPGKPLVDGCYYAHGVAVLKVEGRNGKLLVPGNIQNLSVEPNASPGQTGVTFTPGFHLREGPPLSAVRVTYLQSSSMMMESYTDQPTIMAIKDPMGLIDLVHGPAC